MDTTAPSDLYKFTQGEKVLFTVRGRHGISKSELKRSIISGAIMLIFMCIFILVGFKNFFSKDIIDSITAGPIWDVGSSIFPIFMISLFVIFGIYQIISPLIKYSRAGPWFVGTEKSIIMYKKGNANVFSWNGLTAVIDAKKGNDQGTIYLYKTNVDYEDRGNNSICIDGIDNFSMVSKVVLERTQDKSSAQANVNNMIGDYISDAGINSGIAPMILGIISIVFITIVPISIMCSISAIIIGVRTLKKKNKDQNRGSPTGRDYSNAKSNSGKGEKVMAIIGIILGSLSLVIILLIGGVIAWLISTASPGPFNASNAK